MIVVNGRPPPQNTLKFFERLLPGIWRQWAAAAEAALTQIDIGADEATTITSWHRSPLENK